MEDIPNHIYRREQSSTNVFNLMLVGVSGEGKSTLVKSLFRGKITPHASAPEPTLLEYGGVLEESGTKLRVRCIETSNFAKHNENVYVKYIEDQLKKYFVDQQRLAKWQIDDSRVHCCLYLIPPYTKLPLKSEDIECMYALHQRVNLVPIIARSDTLDADQLARFKENIIVELEKNKINYVKFEFDERADEDRAEIVREEAKRFPFATVAVAAPTEVAGGKTKWIRTLPFGQFNIFDPMFDFGSFANLLIRHCMINLRDDTHHIIYAKFKAEILAKARTNGGEYLSNEIGLKPREVRKILHDIDLDSYHKKLKEEWDKKLYPLREKLLSHRTENRRYEMMN